MRKKVSAIMAAALALGLLASAAFVILFSMLNNKVRGEGDLRQADLALLGVIPYYELEG